MPHSHCNLGHKYEADDVQLRGSFGDCLQVENNRDQGKFDLDLVKTKAAEFQTFMDATLLEVD